jgi:D-psicose/D-tagatose/L-ribulose 3-epimerase
MSFRFRHSICNEVFEGWKFSDTCGAIKKAGYDGIEIAHFTLKASPAEITAAERAEYRRIMRDEGLAFVGLHWLMVAPPGLHVTTPDAELRRKSWQHIGHLVDLCADLAEDALPGSSRLMIFGSPKQRTSTGGLSPAEAFKNYEDGLAGVAPHALGRGVTILAEVLPRHDSDVMNLEEEAAGLVRRIGSPAIQTMFDTHNAADETDPHAAVIERHFGIIKHIHVNEMDGRHPGTGNYDFRPVFATLKRLNYQGWVSLEVFDFSAGAEKIAGDSLRYLNSIIETL